MSLPRNESREQVTLVLPFDHAALTADLEVKLFKVPAGFTAFRVDSVEYINPTGLAASGTDFFEVSLLNGATVVAGPLSTENDAIAANTFTDVELSATDADRVLGAGDTLSVLFDETGAATLPAGRLIVRGRLI